MLLPRLCCYFVWMMIVERLWPSPDPVIHVSRVLLPGLLLEAFWQIQVYRARRIDAAERRMESQLSRLEDGRRQWLSTRDSD